MADGGYDVADYRDVDPLFGTLADFDALVADAHALGLRVIVDIVPNHSSSASRWFQAALRGERPRPLHLPRRGDRRTTGSPPSAARPGRRLPDGQWYLHLFAPQQPDFNWRNPEVHAEFLDILRFWLDRGVDGFRIDVAMGLYKAEGLPGRRGPVVQGRPRPIWGRPEVHEVYRDWRRLLDGYPGERMAVGEVWTDSAEDLALYVRPDELHQSFNFAWLQAPWSATAFRKVIDDTLAAVPVRHLGAVQPRRRTAPHPLRHRRSRHRPRTGQSGVARNARAARVGISLPGGGTGLPEVKDLPTGGAPGPRFRPVEGRAARPRRLPGADAVVAPWPRSHGFSPEG